MIRDAVASDLGSLSVAMVRIQETHAHEFPDVYRPLTLDDAHLHLSALLDEPDFHVRVLEVADRAVAHAITRIQTRPETLFEHSRRVGYLSQIDVEPDCRRNGYGRILLEDSLRIATAACAKRLTLDVWSFTKTPRDFFRAAGWKDFGTKLSIVVDKKSDAA